MASNNHAPRALAGLSLRLHELAIHTGDIKHSCLGCGYVEAWEGILNNG